MISTPIAAKFALSTDIGEPVDDGIAESTTYLLCAFIPSDNPSYFGLKCKRIYDEYIALLILYAVIILYNAFYNVHYDLFLCQRFV